MTTSYAPRVGERVESRTYGAGTLKQIDSFYRGESIAWVLFDAYPKYGWIKTPSSNLRRACPGCGHRRHDPLHCTASCFCEVQS
jgi:hypothetical protein